MQESNCFFLTCMQVSQKTGKVVWYSHLFKNFQNKNKNKQTKKKQQQKRVFQFVLIHTVKGFGIVNKADVFLELSCFFYDSVNVGNLISGSSAFSKSSLYIWKFSVHVLLSLAWRILSITLLACEISIIVW